LEGFNLESEDDLARLTHLHRYSQVGLCVNGVTHDINNLLGAAMAYAELAGLDPNISPESARMMGQIVDGVGRCSVLIKSLTSIARRDRVDVNLASPEQIMTEILQLRDYELKTAQITVEAALDVQIPSLPLDLPKVKLAFIFLLMNAEEALRGKDVREVKVTAGPTEDGAYLEIWDSGDGLTPAQAETAFAPLVSFWPEGRHLGMGLYTAREVAEMHGGTLEYDPERGFRMTFKRENRYYEQL